MARATTKKRRGEVAVNAFLGSVVALAILSIAVMLVGGYAAYTVKRAVIPGGA
jgi:hypothetical protein